MNDIHTGDTVSVSFIGVVSELDDHGMVAMVTLEGEPRDAYIPRSATLEVLERADDPHKDLTGSIRRTKAVTCVARERDGGAGFYRWIAVEINEAFTDDHMRGSHVIGAVPGTPAAEVTVTGEDIDRWAEEDEVDNEAIETGQYYAEKACKAAAVESEPVGGEVERAQQQRQRSHRRTFPYEVREWMDEEARVECFSGRDADHVVHEGVAIGLTEAPTVRVQKDDGQIVSWVIGLTRRAQSDIDELPEWERELLVKEAAKSPEPRVFRSDGPEPPEDVKALEWLDVQEPDDYLYLMRVGKGWLWSSAANRRVPAVRATPISWAGAVRESHGQYREVLPA